MKKCNKCLKEKPLSDFYDFSHYLCKDCSKLACLAYKKKNKKRIKIVNDKWVKNNPSKVIRKERKRNLKLYGLSLEDYEKLAKSQNNLCAICGNKNIKNRNLSVDHCHSSGRIRGLLCNHCNLGIGFFRDNRDLLTKAIDYLMK